MHRFATRPHAARMALIGALAGVLLGGCSTAGGPLALPRSQAGKPIVQDQTIALAEAAVLGAPDDPALRARLGREYLAAGRFRSAAMMFTDAGALGDAAPATALRLALALTGSGQEAAAAALLFERAEELPAADLGLALALAGEVEPAVRVMESAIRDGANGVTLRQNLALAYALTGRWREARLLAGLDVPADKLGTRMERWAALAMTNGTEQRLALVLRVPVGVDDPGVPVGVAYRARDERSAAAPSSPGTAPPAIPKFAAQKPIRAVAPSGPQRLAAAPAGPSAWTLSAYFRRQNRPAGARW